MCSQGKCTHLKNWGKMTSQDDYEKRIRLAKTLLRKSLDQQTVDQPVLYVEDLKGGFTKIELPQAYTLHILPGNHWEVYVDVEENDDLFIHTVPIGGENV